MAAAQFSFLALYFLSVCLVLNVVTGSAQSFDPFPGLFCPPGFAPQTIAGGKVPGYRCDLDPCYSNPCGTGNTCTPRNQEDPSSSYYVPECQCNAPFVAALVSFGPYDRRTVCYVPGTDVCNPNPCKNGATCSYVIDYQTGNPITGDQGTAIAPACNCGPVGRTIFEGVFCELRLRAPYQYTPVQATVNGITGPIAQSGYGGCGNTVFPQTCVSKDGNSYVCCSVGCGPYGADGNIPLCRGQTFVPQPNTYPPSYSSPPVNPPTGDQGVCGTGAATPFVNRCWFNNDPQGRYVCCDAAGCDGFNPPDNSFPHCKNDGYVPPGYGVNPSSNPTPPSSPTPPTPPVSPTPPSGNQGVCGSGAAGSFPTRCWFNNDPQGRYVCCDAAGCDGFNPPDYSFPHCKNNGYVPPGYGTSSGSSPPSSPPSNPPSTPPSGSQGVCGSGAASSFPTRCWFNSDPQGRYVCCDVAGCDGFNPPDYSFPHCKNNGYVPPGYGI